MTDVPVSQEAGKTYPRTCNLCHMDKNPADGCNCGAELIDLIRSEMMSDEHPISEWEVRFAEKIKALPMFARHRQQAERDVIARMEPVAVVGNNWRLLWASGETLTAIVQRTGIKIGSPLYALPTPSAGEA